MSSKPFDGELIDEYILPVMAASSLLCFLVSVVLHSYLSSKNSLTGEGNASVRSISGRFIHGVKAMGFSVVEVQSDGNSMFAALADQLAFCDLVKQCTAEDVRNAAVAYANNHCSGSTLPEKHRTFLKEKNEYEDKVVLHAIANLYDLTIEIVQDETLESRIIRPKSYISAGQKLMKTAYIGYIGPNYYVSLRKDNGNSEESTKTEEETQVKPDTCNERRGTTICHEDIDGNKTSVVIPDGSMATVGVGDNQYFECNGEYQKYTVIPVGRNSNFLIPCKLRTPKELIECVKHFHESRSEFSGANIVIRLTSQTDTSDLTDANDYEDATVETLLENRAAFQQEVDRELDVEIVLIKKGCILLAFKPKSQESVIRFPRKFFSKEFENVLSYILSLAEHVCKLPNELDVHLDIKFEEVEPESRPCGNIISNQQKDLVLQTSESMNHKPVLSKGISIVVRPKCQTSDMKPRLDHLPENLVKAALKCIDKEGLLRPSTEVDVTLQHIDCKCQSERQFDVRPLSSQKTVIKRRVMPSLPKHDIYEELDYLEAWKMTGIIKGTNGVTATAIRAGKHYVLTALHVVLASDPDEMEVIFLEETTGYKLKSVFSSSKLDVAILEIKTPPKNAKPVVYITDISPGEDLFIVGLASRAKSLKKERTTCLNWKNINASLACEDYILFHSEKFREGSSGSPCLKIQEGKLCLVSFVIGELLGGGNEGIAHLGLNMLTFYKELFQQNQELCQNIFEVVYNDHDTCSFCRG